MRRAVRLITEPDNRELQNEISNKVDQVVILTHNVGFYSNSSYEIRRQLKRKSIAEMTAFFQLEKSFEIGKPHQIHSIENPDSISTEYQLLRNVNIILRTPLFQVTGYFQTRCDEFLILTLLHLEPPIMQMHDEAPRVQLHV